MKQYLIIAVLAMVVTGCANQHRLGTHMAQVRHQQVYNPSATQDNLGVIPSGSGERAEDAYSAYIGKKDEVLEGSSTSQVLKEF